MTALGGIAPQFELPDTSGARHGLTDAPASVVFFTSNICPFALAWHDRILDAARDYVSSGVPFYAICSNDAELQAADAPARMRERYEREDWGPVPYLHDASQDVARAYGAETTPDIFVLDATHRLRYRGTADEDCEVPSLNAAWLRAAVDDVLAGREPAGSQPFSVGCPIKWHGKAAHPAGMRPPGAPS